MVQGERELAPCKPKASEEDVEKEPEELNETGEEEAVEIIEVVQEETEELVDPLEILRESCAEKRECASLKDKLDRCNARVESKSKTLETCVEELIDFMHCVDHCASKTLFSKLK